MDEKLDRILDAGVGAVVAATGLALLGTLVAVLNDGDAANDFARLAWTVWVFVLATWAAIILLDYWIPVKDEPRVLAEDDVKADGA